MTGVNRELKLSKDFSLFEFIESEKQKEANIDNTPTPEIIDCLKLLCSTILQPARDALGPLKVTSGYRCQTLNRLVGGSDTSAHKLGYAADIVPLASTKLNFAKWVSHNTKFDQIILELGNVEEPAWIHVSCDPRLRMQILKTTDRATYVPVTL